MTLAGDKVSSYEGKRNGEIVKACYVGVRKRNTIEYQVSFLACVEPCRKLQSATQTKFKLAWDLMSILFASKGQVSKWRNSAQDLVPINPLDEFPHFGWRTTGGVYSTHKPAHA